MLSKEWASRKQKCDFVVVGSGYGGAILAARISGAALTPKPSVCVLERGREWPVGTCPDALGRVTTAYSNPLANPLEPYDLLTFSEISVMKGCGLGGTSLMNANVAIVPDVQSFEPTAWPQSVTLAELQPYYDRARQMLAARPHPKSPTSLTRKRLTAAREIGSQPVGLNMAVNFDIDGANHYGKRFSACPYAGWRRWSLELANQWTKHRIIWA